MKILTLVAASAALIFGLNGCTDAEMADIQQGMQNAQNNSDHATVNFMDAARDCKTYMVDKYPDLPNAAFSVNGYGAHTSGDVVIVPLSVKWDEPLVEESGECIVKNGIVKRYHRTSD